jgi:DNA-binding NarL/FixJ family response regulator
MPVRTMICEDNAALRLSIRTLLDSYDGVEVIADLPDGKEAGALAEALHPDVVIMDIDMPGVDGIAAVRAIKEASPETSIVMFTQIEDDDKLFDSLCAGANGYILKKSPPGRLFDAIIEVMSGGAPMSPAIARRVLNTFHRQTKPFHIKYKLTERETEVLRLLTKGYGVKQIAAELGISFDTTRSHLRNIYRKLHVNCGKEAIAKVLAEKIGQ